MNITLLRIRLKIMDLLENEKGQDLVEYALITALIALGATLSMKALGPAISTMFVNIKTTLAAS
jgi:pilus assembly protein Flp/PilA